MKLYELFMICMLSLSAEVASSGSSASVNSTWFARIGEVVLEVPLSITGSNTTQLFAKCGFFLTGIFDSCIGECYVFGIYVEENNEEGSTMTWQAETDDIVPNSTLHFGLDGNLVVQHPNGSVLWESHTGNQGVQRMELLSSQNLVLYNSDNTKISWQSFDHPTNILVPTQGLGVGQSLNNPPYTLQVQSHGVVLYDTTYDPPQPYGAWASPDIEINRLSFDSNNSLVILDAASRIINRTIIDTTDMSACVTTGLMLSNIGNLTIVCYSYSMTINVQLDDTPYESCRPPQCGAFGICTKGLCSCPYAETNNRTHLYRRVDKDDPSKGCMLPGQKNISASSFVDFLELPGVDLISASYIPKAVMSYEDCKLLCSKNSSCKGLTFKRSSSLCQTSPVMLLVNTSESDVTTFLKVKVPIVPNKTRPRLMKITIFVLTISGFAIIVLLVTLRKTLCTKASKEHQPQKELFFPNLPNRFTLLQLSRMTGEFQNKIGQGGYSTVYQGVLLDGCTKVAVKCLEGGPKQGQKQFEAEVMTIGSMHHRNLVKLLGYGASDDGSDYYLVYELLQNFSLDRWLFNVQGAVLSWQKRVEIALDIASGLCYLHHGCSLKVLHLDIKPQNVVLDANFRAKICDFGLAKQVDTGQSVQTMARGTPGYMAPEWLHSKVSEKADVYSFGLLLLELISGQKTVCVPTCMSVGSSVLGLQTIQNALDTAVLEPVVDARLLGNFDPNQLQKMVELGISCTKEDPSNRPTMQLVVKVIEDVSLAKI